MRKSIFLLPLLILLACSAPEEKSIKKTWLGRSVNFERISTEINTYHMFDSTNTKVGSMIFGTYFENGMLVFRDTSQFDDGSVYEEAEYILDTTNFTIRFVNVSMSLGLANLKVNLKKNIDKLSGVYQIFRDTLVRRIEIDTVYTYDIFRGELYMLMTRWIMKKVIRSIFLLSIQQIWVYQMRESHMMEKKQ